MNYTCFDDLPKEIQRRVIALHPDDFERWIKLAIPALTNKSVIETINEEDGYRRVVQFLGRVEGYFC